MTTLGLISARMADHPTFVKDLGVWARTLLDETDTIDRLVIDLSGTAGVAVAASLAQEPDARGYEVTRRAGSIADGSNLQLALTKAEMVHDIDMATLTGRNRFMSMVDLVTIMPDADVSILNSYRRHPNHNSTAPIKVYDYESLDTGLLPARAFNSDI